MAKLCSAFVGLSNVMPGCLAGLTICEHAAASFLAGCLEGCGGENGSLAGNRLCQRRLTNTTEVVPSVRSKRSDALQKLPSNRLDFDDMEAELGGGLLEQFDLLAAVPVLIILHSFVDVILSVLQHPVHYARKLVGIAVIAFGAPSLARRRRYWAPR